MCNAEIYMCLTLSEAGFAVHSYRDESHFDKICQMQQITASNIAKVCLILDDFNIKWPLCARDPFESQVFCSHMTNLVKMCTVQTVNR